MKKQKYNPYYEWSTLSNSLTQEQGRLAGQVLARIPVDDLAELQRLKTRIDAKDFDNRLQFGAAFFDSEQRSMMCLVRRDLNEAAVIRGVFAHELAHIFLGHCTWGVPKWYSEAEREELERHHEIAAERRAAAWGFLDELKAVNEAIRKKSHALLIFGIFE